MRSQRICWVAPCAAASFLLAGAAAHGHPVLSFNEATGGNATNQNQSVGWQFNVVSPLTVTGLGWFDQGANGLSVSHTVGIWNPSGTLLSSVVVPAGVAAPLDGQYRTSAVAPFTLPVGTGYIVGGQNFSTSTDRLASNVSHTVDSRISYVDATFSNLNSGFVRPTQFSVAFTGFYGPSFSVVPVPEPSSITLAFLAATAMAWFAQRHR